MLITKTKYFNIESTGFLFELKSDKQVSPEREDDEQFEAEWATKETIEKEIKDELHKKNVRIRFCHPGAMEGDGIHINSGFLNGLNKEDAIQKCLST